MEIANPIGEKKEKVSDERPTHLDLFSGIGGFSLAFEAEGFRTIGFSEIDPYASAVLKKHWPAVPNYGDIENVPAIECDILTGGFPCQPFSVSGKRRGASDDRALWPQMLSVIARCRPAFVLGENVPGIINMELDRVLSDLERIGYATRAFVVPACAVDARHRRDRVWILANSISVIGGAPWTSCMETTPAVAIAAAGEQSAPMADTESGGRRERNSVNEWPRKGTGAPQQRSGPSNGDKVPAHTNLQRQPTESNHERNGAACRDREANKLGGSGKDGVAKWPTEPELGRVANGIPNRSHRLKCLGNSIVPQVSQIFARAIRQQIK